MENLREGLIPTVLGTAVTTTGVVLRNNRSITPLISGSIIGFGLAHIVLGAIDLVEHRR
ncbi:asparagine synthase [Psychrobacillus glaciei]|uniref:Asparagine synthase n=1 Tax=Psychrobacillus glaciei TaxID=2283160 RepID=A0A5J6SPZ7_9BACI|nr:asparagine synthase [Psychrobacillus glaciei]QFG00026.1 asparagine synthase [Psychrobacillus glaciei]